MIKEKLLNAGRCLNCLAAGHFAWDCPLDCKYTTCGTKSMNKHTCALHDLFSKRSAATANKDAVNSEDVNSEQLISRKTVPNSGGILLRTSAVKVINPTTGESTLAYAQHEIASQATLILERLRKELNLDVKPDNVIIRILAEQTTKCFGLTEFSLRSLCDNKFILLRTH